MSIKPILGLVKNRQLSAALDAKSLFKPFYKVCFLTAAKRCGLLELLQQKPRPIEELHELYCRDAKAREALEAWLQVGIRLRLLALKADGYCLRGLAKRLAMVRNDAALALVQEVADLHHKLIIETPSKLRAGTLWQLDDQDGALTTRSSRALEPFLTSAMDRAFTKQGPVRLLEIGCGSAHYIRHAAQRNPSLRAVGLELQPDVAEIARANVETWGLTSRVEIETVDVLDKPATPAFDYVTLHNNIYYFPVNERVALLEHVKKFVAPDGILLLTTCCRGGNVSIEVLSLWGAATAGAGRLPDTDEMQEQLRAAGYRRIKAYRLIPGDSYYAFEASIAS